VYYIDNYKNVESAKLWICWPIRQTEFLTGSVLKQNILSVLQLLFMFLAYCPHSEKEIKRLLSPNSTLSTSEHLNKSLRNVAYIVTTDAVVTA
jgi:hypothetical protein